MKTQAVYTLLALTLALAPAVRADSEAVDSTGQIGAMEAIQSYTDAKLELVNANLADIKLPHLKTKTKVIRCESKDYKARDCGIGVAPWLDISVNQISKSACTFNKTYAYIKTNPLNPQADTIRVTNGCRADFTVRYLAL